MSEMPINLTDIGVLMTVLISGFLAFFRGFIKEILSIAAWITAFFAGLYGYHLFVPYIEQLIPDPGITPWISGILLGLITVIFLSLISHYAAKALKLEGLGAVDRSLGFIYGIARGIIVISICFLMLQWGISDSDYPNWLKNAKSLPLIQTSASLILRVLPTNFAAGFNNLDLDSKVDPTSMSFERLNEPSVKPSTQITKPGYTVDQRSTMDRAFRNLK